MVPYFGNHSGKMFIRGKPIRFGYKIWALCASNGFPYCLQLYEGKKENNNQPLGSQVVNTLLDAVEDCRQHTVYFDNFFTSYDLLFSLKEHNMRATGPVRDNRTAKCPLQTENEIKKLAKGSHDNCSDGNVLFCRWKDNAVVKIGSNFEAVTHSEKQKGGPKKSENMLSYHSRQWFRIIMRGWEEWTYWTSYWAHIDQDCEVKSGIGTCSVMH